ncbi:MAG: hypothetical protein QXR80_05475 [Desulfurococcaceae archaeon]
MHISPKDLVNTWIAPGFLGLRQIVGFRRTAMTRFEETGGSLRWRTVVFNVFTTIFDQKEWEVTLLGHRGSTCTQRKSSRGTLSAWRTLLAEKSAC